MMKASLVYVICLILFLLPLSADDSVKLPVEEIRRQMSIFGAAKSADTKIQAASLLARLIQADGREEEYDRMFRKQAEDDPSATKSLLALSECMHVWGCTAESVKLLTEATKRQPSDFSLQALLAERLDQSGEPNKAAPIFASLVAEHRSPELLRRYAAFLFRIGDIDQGSTIASQLVMEAKNGREPEALAQELLSQQEWTYTRDFLSPLLTRFPNDWRLAYLHAYALARIAPDAKAFAEFLALTKNHEEIPDLFSSINAVERFPLSDPAVLQKILSSLSPEDALLFRYLATAQTASPVESNRQTEFVGGRSDMNPEALLPFLTLPSTVLDLRLYALRHCFAIASGLPIAQRSELLAKIQAPDFPFIDRMKNAAMVNLEASSSVFRPVAAMDLSSFTPIGERAMKSKEMSNAIQAAMVVSDYTTAVDLANQSIKLPASFFSNNFRILSYADRSQHLYRISNKPTITFTPDYISGMFGVSNLARSFAPTSLRPPLPSPTHVELLKILGETITASPDAPPFFRITDSEKFLAAVAKIDSPFQRVLILYACDMKESLLQNLTDLTKAGATSSGEILFWASAYYANEGSNLSIAYELAIRARAALDPIHHAAADAQLVTLGLLLQGDRKTTPDLSAAKSAALEFSRFAVEESSRKELAGVFKSFGLNEAAAQLAQPHLIGAARLRAISMYRKSSQDVAAAATPTERPAALRRLYRVLRTMLRFDLLDRSSYFSPNTFIQSVQELQLVPDLAATMFPPPGSSYERRQEYAIIMAKLDDVIKVMPLLETLHSERPSDTAILSLLCVASPMPRRLELFDLLCQSSEDDLSDFADAIIPMLHTQGVTDSDVFRKIFADWRSIAVLLARIPPEKSNSKNLTWLNEPATRFFVDCPSYHEPVGQAKNQQDTPASKEAAILAKLHDTVAKEVAISMLKHAATAAYGFTLLAAGKSTFGVDDRAMLAMAKDAYRVKLSAVDFHAPYPTRRYVSYSRGGHFSGFPTSSVNLDWHTNTPFRHLLAQTSASNTFYQISDFLPSLPEPAKSELKAWLDYFTTPSPAAAIALLATLSRERYLGKSENILTLALEITALCNLDPSPGLGMLVEQVEVTAKAETSHYYYDSSRVILLMQTIYSHFQSRNKNDAVTPLLTKAIARVLGPASCWPLYAKVLGENASNDSSIRQRHQTFTSLLSLDNIGPYESYFTNLRIGLATGLLGIDGRLPHIPTFSSYGQEHRLADDLISSGLFKSGAGMFFPDGSFLPLLVAKFDSDNPTHDPAKNIGEKLLAIDGPNRFWARLTGAYWTRSDASLPLVEVNRELPTIKQWFPANQRALASFLKQRWPELASSTLAEWFEQSLMLDSAERETSLRKLAERFSEKSFKAIEIPPLLFPLIEQDPQKAAALWLDIFTTTPEPVRQRAHRLLIEAQIKAKTLHIHVAPANQLTFLLTLLTSKNSIISADDQVPIVNSLIYQLLESPPLSSKPDPDFKNGVGIKTKSFASLLLFLRTFDDSVAAHLVGAFLENNRALCDYESVSSLAMLKWLETTIAPDRPKLARAALLAMHAGSPPPNTLPDVEPLNPALLAFLNAPGFTPMNCLHLLHTAFTKIDHFVWGPQITKAAIDILTRAELQSPENALIAYEVLTKLEKRTTLTAEMATACCTNVIPKLLADGVLPENYCKYLQPDWLRLAAYSRQESLFTEACRFDASKTIGDLDLTMLLFQFGMLPSAATLVPPPELPTWSIADRSYGYNNDEKIPSFTATIQNHLTRFLQQLPDAGQRFRMELHIANFPDAEGIEKPTLSRDERLRQLATRYQAEAPPEIIARSELLAILGAGDSPENLNELLTLTADLDYVDLLDAKTTALASFDTQKARPAIIQLSLIERTIEATLRTGRSDFWSKQMKSLTRISSWQSKNVQYEIMTKMLKIYGPKHINIAISAPATEHERLLQQAKAVALLFDNRNTECEESISNTCYQFLLLTHLATGRSKDFADCWKSLPDSLTKPRERTPEYSGANVLKCFEREYFTASDGSNTASQLFSLLLTNPDLNKIILPRMKYLYCFNESGFLTREEIYNAIEAVPDTYPRKASYLIGRALLFGFHDQQTDISLKDCARANQLAESQQQAAVVQFAKATEVQILVSGGRYQNAIKVAATVDAAQLDDDQRKDFTQLRDSLKTEYETK